MIGEKEIKEAERNIPQYLTDGLLSRDSAHAKFVPFYMNNSKLSFQLASHVFKLSSDAETKKNAGFPADMEFYLWVVVTSYYSMFYAANAALAKLGLKVADKIPHRVTQDALIVYFLKSKKLAKYFLEDYKATKQEVLSVMGMSEEELLKEFQMKATELVATFDFQRQKRGDFQYHVDLSVKQNVAQLSLERARKFVQEIASTIEKIR